MNNISPITKVAVVGVGAVGGVFAAWLCNLPAGQIQLSALARGETLKTLQTKGLSWVDSDGQENLCNLNASDDASALGVQDLIIISVKGPAMPQIAQSITPMLASHTIVLVAMNGVPWWFFDGMQGPCAGLQLKSVDPDGHSAAALPTKHVLGCVVHLSAAAPHPARIERIKNKQLIIGEPAGGISPRVQAVASLLTQAGFEVKATENIQNEIWFKLWGNMTMNPVSALTGATCDRILNDPLVRSFCSAVMLEAQTIGKQIGCHIQQVPEDRHAITRSLGSFKTSMLQDVEAGRAIELDAVVSAVREIGQHLGLVTPNIDALLGLTRLMARNKGLYPE